MSASRNPWDPELWSAPADWQTNGSLPLVTLGILTCNRREDLRQTLDVLQNAVQYPLTEIIVIDNGSTDGTIEMLKSEFPSVRLHEVGWNMGTAARNHQTVLAGGKYLFSFDDDSFPGTPSTIYRVVEYMESHPDVDVVNGTCYRPQSGISETAGWEKYRYGGDATEGYEGIYLVEGGVCYRVETLRKVEGFDPAIFYDMDGPELALQLYKLGSRIVLREEFLTLHFPSMGMRSAAKAAYWKARHPVWLMAKHWQPFWLPVLLPLWVVRRFLGWVLYPSTTAHSIRGLMAGFVGIFKFLPYKPKLTWKQAMGLKRFYIQLFRW